jgi:hypothetical protein
MIDNLHYTRTPIGTMTPVSGYFSELLSSQSEKLIKFRNSMSIMSVIVHILGSISLEISFGSSECNCPNINVGCWFCSNLRLFERRVWLSVLMTCSISPTPFLLRTWHIALLWYRVWSYCLDIFIERYKQNLNYLTVAIHRLPLWTRDFLSFCLVCTTGHVACYMRIIRSDVVEMIVCLSVCIQWSIVA